jgi:hypothetical protein
MSKATKFHPFYDEIKHCRKTAWNTPEHLTEQDIETIKKLVPILQANDLEKFYDLVTANTPQTEGLFYRILGWPEGLNYCHSYMYCEYTALPGMIRHNLPKLMEFLTNSADKVV